MNCAKHPEVTAAAYCRTCGKALCETCRRDVRGVIYCEDCLASRVQGTVPPAAIPVGPARTSGPHPAVAGVLAGFFPFGVGQAYNGQYARGLAHLLIFVALIYGADHAGPFDFVFGIGIAAFYFFQMIDAIRSARYLQSGLPAPDPFGLDNLFGGSKPQPAHVATAWNLPADASTAPPPPANVAMNVPPAQNVAGSSVFAPPPEAAKSDTPYGAIVLIGLGIIFFLSSSGLFHSFWIGRAWPLGLVVIGLTLLARNWSSITTRRSGLMGPAVLLTLGGLFLAQIVRHVAFWRSFPLLLIVIGLVLFYERTAPPVPPPPPPSGGMGNGSDNTHMVPGEEVQAARDREPER